MKFYQFKLLMIPSPQNLMFPGVKWARAITWVQSDSIDSARVKANMYHIGRRWEVTREEAATELPIAEHPRNQNARATGASKPGEALEGVFQSLIREGISSELFGLTRG